MATTISEQCKCGGAIVVTTRSYFKSWLLHDDFTARHIDCITSASDDVITEPGGDVFTSSERAGQHSQHELQIGFQRDEW